MMLLSGPFIAWVLVPVAQRVLERPNETVAQSPFCLGMSHAGERIDCAACHVAQASNSAMMTQPLVIEEARCAVCHAANPGFSPELDLRHLDLKH